MIDTYISAEHAAALEADGIKRVNWYGDQVFVFTGPGMSVARLAYSDIVPSALAADVLTDQSRWDTAILRAES